MAQPPVTKTPAEYHETFADNPFPTLGMALLT